MIFFFTVVTVIVPALVLAGVLIFAARDARERASEVQGSPDGTIVPSLPASTFAVPSVALAKEGSSTFQVRHARSDARAPHTPRRIFSFSPAKFGKCS